MSVEPHGCDRCPVLDPVLPCEDAARKRHPDTEEALARSRPHRHPDLRLPAPGAMSVRGTSSEPELTKKDPRARVPDGIVRLENRP